jgi:hypothetical protein
MAFQDSDWLELRPITLLFGRNSSGKSALIRALRLFKQSLDPEAGGKSLRFRSRTGLNQGRFENTLYRGARLPLISFGFRCKLDTVEPLRELVNRYLAQNNVEPISSEAIHTNQWDYAELVVGYWRNGLYVEAAQSGLNCPWVAEVAPSLSPVLLRADRLFSDWGDVPLWPETALYEIPITDEEVKK